jgi:hypothetical protein
MKMRIGGFNHHQVLSEEKEIFLKFMREKYPIFYNSNIFFRDIHFAITSFFTLKEKPINYGRAEQLTYNFIKQLEETGELQKVSNNAWRVNFKFEDPLAETEIEETITEER